jgi:rhodanese-related sulfurtransferase
METQSNIASDECHRSLVALTNAVLIDVRTPAEYRAVHATSARNVPLHSLDVGTVQHEMELLYETPVYLICKSGSRAREAQKKFVAAGFASVCVVEGGTEAWEAAGLPVERGTGVMSLERQVRIAAGSLVLLGLVLALTVHPYAAGLSAFVGAGLVFAGVTDTCGLAMLLARMPWNNA